MCDRFIISPCFICAVHQQQALVQSLALSDHHHRQQLHQQVAACGETLIELSAGGYFPYYLDMLTCWTLDKVDSWRRDMIKLLYGGWTAGAG